LNNDNNTLDSLSSLSRIVDIVTVALSGFFLTKRRLKKHAFR